MKRICLLSIILLLSLASIAHPGGIGAASYLRSGVDAEALGMGGAFVAIADNYSAGYWNPAGIAANKNFKIGGMYLNPYGVKGLSFNYLAGIGHLEFISLAGTYSGFSAIYHKIGEDLSQELVNYREDVYIASAALALPQLAQIGASIKRYDFRAPEGGVEGKTAYAHGFGLDLGMIKILKPPLQVGIAVFDLGGTNIKWHNTPTEPSNKVASVIKLGASYTMDKLTVAAEYDIEADQPSRNTVRAGAEFKPIPVFAIRAGSFKPSNSGFSLTLGAGINLENINVDFAWVQNKSGLQKAPNAGDTIVLSSEILL